MCRGRWELKWLTGEGDRGVDIEVRDCTLGGVVRAGEISWVTLFHYHNISCFDEVIRVVQVPSAEGL